jgi:hypothetical protein
MRPVQIDWRTALTYVTRDPAWKWRIGIGGLLMLVVPPVGWLLAIGYRSLVVFRVLDRLSPLLPPWRGHFATAFRRGVASLGVILAYLTPFLIAYWVLGFRTPASLSDHWREVVTFLGVVVLYPPVAMPALPVLYGVRYDWLDFSAMDLSVLAFLFFGGIALGPAAFLQVAQHRRFLAALRIGAVLQLIAAVPRLYAEAWIVSLAVSAVSVIVVPLAPWMLFWSYLVISHLFLQVLAAGHAAQSRQVSSAMTNEPLHLRVEQLERQVRAHQRISLAALVAVSVVATAAFQAKDNNAKFTELTVERLNVIEPDGQLVLTIANTARLPDPLIAGKTVETGRTGPGMIFFDGKGWEVGGLTFNTRETDTGYRASGHFAFDQFRNDQVVYLSYQDNGTRKTAGLYVVDRARTPRIDELLAMREQAQKASPEDKKVIEEKMRGTQAQRIFVGSDEETAMVRLRDRAGRDRIRMSVNAQGVAQLEFLDEAGKVVDRLPK